MKRTRNRRPRKNNNVLWKYEPNILNEDEYNIWVAQNINSISNRSYTKNGIRIDIRGKHIAPTIKNGDLVFTINKNSRDNHCHVAFQSPELIAGLRLRSNKTYKFSGVYSFSEETIDVAKNISWCIPIQFWQLDGWNPPFALLVQNGQYYCQLLAHASSVFKEKNEWEIDKSKPLNMSVDSKFHSIDMIYKPSIKEDGYASIAIDGKKLYENIGPNMINTLYCPASFFGLYSSKDAIGNGLSIIFKKVVYEYV